MESKRLDLLVAEKFNISREYAKEAILKGQVMVDGRAIYKPGAKFLPNSYLSAVLTPPEFVSRAGQKLKFALEKFKIDLSGLECLDIGASTGGFTDCMLKKGAKRVIALENGNGQLSSILENDKRVISIENTDIRDVSLEDLPFTPQFIACDVSFISVTKIAHKISELLPSGLATILIKPQFEVGRENINKNGIANSKKSHDIAINKIIGTFKNYNMITLSIINSPIKGKSGNMEYLIFLEKGKL